MRGTALMTTTGCLPVLPILGSSPCYVQTHSLIPPGDNAKFSSSYYDSVQILGTLSDIYFFFFLSRSNLTPLGLDTCIPERQAFSKLKETILNDQQI